MGLVEVDDLWPMQEGINEVIVTTWLNAAPIGIICKDSNLMMAVYRTSHTAANIEAHGLVVANIIHDPLLFVTTAFSDLPDNKFIKEEIDGRSMWRLKDATCWVAYAAKITQKTEQKILVSLEPIRKILTDTPMIPINRGMNCIIEAAVHGTRYILTRDPDLKRLIDHYAALIIRCGGDREIMALKLLLEYIN